ncbi:MAG TPA: carbohydrate binding domain-containing protein, partial [Anaerolineae bacterium]
MLKRSPILLVCLFAWAVVSATLHAVASQPNCPTIYNGNNGWVIDLCDTDLNITTPMAVTVDGVSRGNAALVRIYHKSQIWPGTPQVAVIYASGFVRLKQNADPSPPIPFGSSFVLGPAYWPSSTTYYHNPQLDRLDIDTRRLPNGPLRMNAQGTNHGFDVSYELVLPPPRDRQTRLHVAQVYTATTGITVDPSRRAERQGFKLVQVSSMFANQGGMCDGGRTDCHDSNAIRFIGSDLIRRQVSFTTITPSAFVVSPTLPLGGTWLDVLHTDDQGWQGNTPNVRVALDTLPAIYTVSPQGWISATTNPDDDNVGVWLHDDGPASQSWTAGQSGRTSYWLLAQDNPPEPWSDLGLRAGLNFLDFEGTYNCFPVLPSDRPGVTGTLSAIAGYSDAALQLNYNLVISNGNWAQVRCNFNPPLDLSAYDHLRFDWRGDPNAANSLEIGLINPNGSQETIFARGYHHPTHRGWWGQLVIPFSFLHPWTNGTTFDPGQVSAFFVSVVKDPVDDVGGLGSIAIDNLSAFNVISRSVPSAHEAVEPNPVASDAAAIWLAGQQRATGLVKSWAEESTCVAHTYDEALALLVFTNEQMWTQAFSVTNALSNTQNIDGSWFKSRNCDTLAVVDPNPWEGDIAWAIYALSAYIDAGGSHPSATAIRDRAADWLVTRINPVDGCLIIDHTEGTIDAWWAFYAAGPAYTDEANGLKNCLLTQYWDEAMGRFKGGKNWYQPYLDNQTWGAAFLSAIGEVEDARRAL